MSHKDMARSIVVPQVAKPKNIKTLSISSEDYPVITSGVQKLSRESIKVENVVGYAQIPLGVTSPLTIRGDNQKGTFLAPLATVEPTLVASCSRGCKAFQQHGGIRAFAIQERMSRAPVFGFGDIEDAVAFYKMIPQLKNQLHVDAEKTSRFAMLQSVTPNLIGKEVHVKFDYTCGDASGQNMTTIATHAACTALLATHGEQLRIKEFRIEGQLATDKKLSLISIFEPRGVQVMAWGTLSNDTCRTILGQSAESIHKAIMSLQSGAIRAGMIGSNINTANIFAAMFIACGQDAASVLESGWTQLTSSYDNESKDLTLSLFIPSLAVGSVGGGTMYGTQKESLEMLGCVGDGKKWALAETIASFALALEISTISAIANDTFAQSHKRLARSSRL